MIKINGKKVAGIGQPGLNGKSAYEAAKEGGYSGTEQEFNAILANVALKPKATFITLASSAWSNNTQTITVQGILADESKQLIQPMPAMASQNAYAAAGIACTLQETDSLTFKCQTVPTENITVFVTVQGVS